MRVGVRARVGVEVGVRGRVRVTPVEKAKLSDRCAAESSSARSTCSRERHASC